MRTLTENRHINAIELTRIQLGDLVELVRDAVGPGPTVRLTAPVPGGEVTSESVDGLWTELSDPASVRDVTVAAHDFPLRHVRVWLDRRNARVSVGGQDETWVYGTASRLESRLLQRQYKHWTALKRTVVGLSLVAGVSGVLGLLGLAGLELGPFEKGLGPAVYPVVLAQLLSVYEHHRRRGAVVVRDASPPRSKSEFAVLVLTGIAALAAVVQVVISWPSN